MPTITKEQVRFFHENGYLIIDDLLSQDEITYYQNIYEDFLHNKIDVSRYRSDLGGYAADEDVLSDTERITQIMVPGKTLPALLKKPLHTKTLSMARQLLGEDMALDFDMLIDKAPFSHTPTPWHQDAAYWIKLPDTRAVSCWVALDKAEKDNGCMWYIPGSHKLPLRVHYPAGRGGGALECEGYEEEAVAVELEAGGCVLHHGGTAHYSRGNASAMRRRAFITNYRPQAMIDLERTQGFDHTGERKVRNS